MYNKNKKEPIKVIVAGSRSVNDYEFVEQKLLHIFSRRQPNEINIVCGMASGADALGKKFAEDYNVPLIPMPANWEDMTPPCVVRTRGDGVTYNALAGNKRNEEMAKIATHLVLFWDGKSSGSKDMLSLAKKYNLIIKEYILEIK